MIKPGLQDAPLASVTVSRSEWRWCLGAAAIVMAVTCLPYLIVWNATPPGTTFLGFLVNPDDQCVYLAWMKQASEGHFFLRNLWTADPQRGINVHLLFWALGVLARLTALPLPLVYHLGRLLLGAAVMLLFYRFAALFTDQVPARRTCFWLAAFSAGFGWLYPGQDVRGFVDSWQPEAITFQSLYSNTLFSAGLALMLAVLSGLLAAEQTGERRWAVAAGLAGGLLANIHSYDVITLAAVWGAYLLVRVGWERGLPSRALLATAVAAAVALPFVAYQLYVYFAEPVFRQRADATITQSPEFWKLLLGYGLLVPLAAAGAARLLRRARSLRDGAWMALPVVWAVVGFAMPYAPVSFQRKMAMGLHLPLALLAGIALDWIAGHLAMRAPKPIAAQARAGIAAAVIALTAPTNIVNLNRHVIAAVTQNLSSNNFHPVYWWSTEFQALDWADRNLKDDPVLQALTVTSALIPPFTGNRVWAGHWSETPRFHIPPQESKIGEVTYFFSHPMAPEARLRFLRVRQITHLFFGPRERIVDDTHLVEAQLRSAPFLHPLHTTGTGDTAVTIYAVISVSEAPTTGILKPPMNADERR